LIIKLIEFKYHNYLLIGNLNYYLNETGRTIKYIKIMTVDEKIVK